MIRAFRYALADLLNLVADICARIDAHFADALNPKDDQ